MWRMTWQAISGMPYLSPAFAPLEALLHAAVRQGLTLVHFSAQLKRILSGWGASRDLSGGVLEV